MRPTVFQIIFRQLHDPIPDGWVAGVRWVVEAYPAGACNLPYPLGQAWVSDYSHLQHQKELVSLDFIQVADQCRRQGVARALYESVKGRWPTIYITNAISPAGAAFLDAVEPWRIGARTQQVQARHEERRRARARKKLERQRKK